MNDPSLDILTRSVFINVTNSHKIKPNSANQKNIVLNTENPGFISVRFEATCPNILNHQDLYIDGSNKELGNWQFEKGLKMDDSSFPLFTATILMKNDKKPQELESKQQHHIHQKSTDKTEPKSYVLPKKPLEEISYPFPFEYKFVIVKNDLKEHEIEVDDHSPLNSEELKKLEEMKEEEKKHKIGNSPINEEKLIKLMNRKKKINQKCIEKVAIWESSPNRYCPGITSHVMSNNAYPSTLLINSWYVNPNNELLKLYDLSVPLFSL